MKTVVSIDFDIVMAPSIETYDSQVPFKDWEYLMGTSYLYRALSADYIHYYKIFTYLTKCVKVLPKENVKFIVTHEQIVDYVTEPVGLINVDHHHDVGYGRNDPGVNEANCANWVKVLRDKGLLSYYTWINNPNSETIGDLQIEKIISMYDTDIEDLPMPDQLFICLSSPWVPPYICPLFDVLMEYCSDYYGSKFTMTLPEVDNTQKI